MNTNIPTALTNLIRNEQERSFKLFSAKHKPGFTDRAGFSEWFTRQLNGQDFRCYYCQTAILDIQDLIAKGLLKTRATGYGVRGPVLEVDKCHNELPYSPSNCVLACYYCNNDKSYTLEAESYKRFFGPNRKIYFDHLLQK
ncbi:hypothetical protein [Mucilaginibacter flavidus]|uniref:hypothetical protein n=1 Tax=Mucilaginibacter flavidus TaxID=2949309 RepID=UPI00209282F8|nr:hypothetical protein [Mucilaginibacter flavidus]MCO5950902.1 hypothetical protein [Mucilaginibacter flavidus]